MGPRPRHCPQDKRSVARQGNDIGRHRKLTRKKALTFTNLLAIIEEKRIIRAERIGGSNYPIDKPFSGGFPSALSFFQRNHKQLTRGGCHV